MSRTARRVAIASLALGLGFTGTAAAMVEDNGSDPLAGFLGLEVVGGVADDLPAITGDVESGLAGLLGGGDLLGGILGGTGGILDEVLGGLGDGLGNGIDGGPGGGIGAFLGQDLAIQPVPTIGAGETLENPRVGPGILGGLLDVGSITGLLAGRL